MASDQSFIDYILDQLTPLAGLSYKKMFGEYALYHHGKVIGFVCDNQLYIKPTDAGRAVLKSPVDGFPYPGAKAHFQATDAIDDADLLRSVVVATSAALPEPTPKKPKKNSKAQT